MRDDVLERMRMAEQDDDGDDAELKQLRQLRQVWLAMPDEDPPTRGLDALMAAARSQAEVMQPKPSWWKRMLATMVRPPALAMATIVVVAGGAVLVHRHHDELDATATTTVESPPVAAGSAAAVTPRGDFGQAGKDKTGESEQLDGKLERKEERGSGDATLKSPEITKPPPSTPAPTPQVTHAAVTKKLPPAPPPPAPPPADDRKPLDQEAAADEVPQPKHVVLTPQQPTRPKPAEPSAKPEPPKAEPVDTPKPTTGTSRGLTTSKPGNAQLATDNNVQAQPESVDSMLRRAREAATRGDCATAKAIAAQIAKQDAAFYRNTTVKDAVVAKCL